MDFTDDLAEQKKFQDTESSEGNAMLAELENQDEIAATEAQEKSFNTAYSGSDLGNVGPSDGDYDYPTAFQGGNTFKPDNEGGINLDNKYIQPATSSIGGYDVVTGEKYTTQYADREGLIVDGIERLQGSSVNTAKGAPPQDMLAMTRIARGMNDEQASYNDFDLDTPVTISSKQKTVAWDSMKQAKRVQSDTRETGSRYFKEAESLKVSRMDGIQPDIDETELKSSASWIQSGRTVVDYFNPNGSQSMDEQEIHDFNLSLMSSFNWNIPMMMFYTNEVIQANDPELAKSFLYLLDQNDATNVSAASVGRAIGGVFGDISTYGTVGGSVLVSRLAGASMKAGVRQALTKIMTVSAVDAAAGGTVMAVDEISRQTVEKAAGEREELDTGEVAAKAAVGATVGGVGGPAVAAVVDPILRNFGVNTVKNAMGTMNQAPEIKAPIQVSEAPIRSAKQVEFTSRLDDALDSTFKNKKSIPVKKLRNKVRQWVSEGKIPKEEVDWSGINMLAKDGAVTQDEIKAYVNFNRPTPSLDPVTEIKFSHLNLSSDQTGYREYVINVDKTGTFTGPIQHFGETGVTPKGSSNVGHLRLADSNHGDQRGTMFLEGQSDIRKNKTSETVALTPQAMDVKMSQEKNAVAQAEKAQLKADTEYENFLLGIAKKNNIEIGSNPSLNFELLQAMNGNDETRFKALMNKSMAAFDVREKAEKAFNKTGEVPFTPFRDKNRSNDLLFRTAVMESMNGKSQFLSWPKSFNQNSIIQGWEIEGLTLKDPRLKSASNFMTKEMKKIAESYGFKVEEFVPDEFKNKKRQVQLSTSGEEGQPVVNLGSVEREMDDNVFYRIVFTPEQREKWGEEGVSMYSFGAPVAAAAGFSVEGDE